jgi:isopenicillin-N epimerase
MRNPSAPNWGPDWPEVRALWTLDPDVAFLNHGSFGASPRPLLEAQQRIREALERQPVDFFVRDYEARWTRAREAMAGFVGARSEDLVFVENATTGVNAVVASWPLVEGEEVVTTSHAYEAVRNTLDHTCRQRGVAVRHARVPYPCAGPQQVLDAVEAELSERTRLLVVDHVSSATGLIYPVHELVRLGHQRGALVLIDGAHAPGMLPLQLDALGADFYTGNAHKWMCTPKGAALLWVRREHQPRVRPPVTSNFHGQGFQAEFGWTGTRDPSAWMCVPEAVEFGRGLGWDKMRRYGRELVRFGRELLATLPGIELGGPTEMHGQLASVLLPAPADAEGAVALCDRLRRAHGVEVAVSPFEGRAVLRISGQVYNHPDEYRRLVAALSAELG